jgi:hypothetical protein
LARKQSIKFKVGDKVYDTWWPYWGLGKVVLVLKTRVKVKFSEHMFVYDKAHCKFLKKAE